MFSSSSSSVSRRVLLMARKNKVWLQQQQQHYQWPRSLSTLVSSNYVYHHYEDDWSRLGENRAASTDTINRNFASYSNSKDDENDGMNNDNNDNVPPPPLRPHKHVIPPIRAPPPPPPPPPSRLRTTAATTTIVEPPVRSRPFRPFSRNKLHKNNFRSGGKKKTVMSPNNTNTNTNDPAAVTTTYASYPVQAVQIAQQIDLAAAISKVFATKGLRKMIERLSVVIQLPPDINNNNNNVNDKEGLKPRNQNSQQQQQRFIAVFRFGSVVFFNVAPRDVAKYIKQLKMVSIDPVLSGNEIKENFCVHVQPEIYAAMRSTTSTSSGVNIHDGGEQHQHNDEDIQVVSGDYCIVQELNMKSVDVISNIMAQSVALDSYNDTVDELLANFEKINSKVVRGGTSDSLSTMDRDQMFRAVARNNSIFIEMVSRVGIKDRIDTAWNLSQYEDIHDGLKEEFDIDQRFEHIEFKLNLIQQNAKFFLEVLAHQKSNSLEWMIIVLIMFECVLMVMEMSGVGEVVFGALGDKILK